MTFGYSSNTLFLLSAFAVGFAILVITFSNLISSVFCLIGLFLTIAIILILLGMDFLALAYLLVYVGAVSILFLSIVFFIDFRASDFQSIRNKNIPLTVFICLLVLPIHFVTISPEKSRA